MRYRSLLILGILILLVSCSLPGRATPTADAPTLTPVPTLSPTPTAPLVILILPADMPQDEKDQYQTVIYDLAQANGMRFQVRNVLTLDDLAFEGPSLKIVIALPPDPGLAALAAAAPQVQFLAVGIPGLTAGSNLSSVGASGVPVDQQAFLAGYIAGMVAPEWKVGVLYQRDPTGEAARDAFANGFAFYCGNCRNPYFTGPVGIYPVMVGIPADAPLTDYNGNADILRQNIVRVAFVYPPVATPEVLSYMAQHDLYLISQEMPGEDLRANWVTSIQPDLIFGLHSIFPDLLAGRGGQDFPTPLVLADVNTGILTEAKQRLVQEVLSGLQNGTIGTGVNP